jgi:hypothetical protein
MSFNRLLTVVVAATFAFAAQADVIYVDIDNCLGPGSGTPADPFCSIQDAISAALDGDEITVAPGIYFETIDFLGKAITLLSAGGPDVTTIDGQGGGSVVICNSGEGPGTVLDGFTITKGTGYLPEPDSYTRGGGMLNEASHPTVTNCVFLDNTARYGAGMYNDDADPVVIGCVFAGNQTEVSGLGGGISNNLASPTVIDCLFMGNSVPGGPGGGGGLFNGAGHPIFVGCVFLDNTASRGGGGILNGNSEATLVNCLLAGNYAGFEGGGIRHLAAVATLWVINCTLSQNDASDVGGGISIYQDSKMEIANSIVWANSDADGSGESSQINDPQGTTTVNFSCVQGGWSGSGANNIASDPKFVDPDNGDFRLAPDSPCIDAGDNTAVPQDITTDLDGNPRFLEIPETPDTGNGDLPIVDIGAYESLGGGCLAILSQEVVCHGDGSTFTVNIQGLNACTGGTTMVTFTGSGGDVGEDFCATLLIHTEQGGFCCSTQVCVPVPDCSPPVAPYDLDGDGVVDVVDLLILLGAWGPNLGHPADLDLDGEVGVTDFLLLLANWGP